MTQPPVRTSPYEGPHRDSRVYVLEMGVYEDQYVVGVYSTPELAMAEAEGAWTQHEYDGMLSWWNDLDWSKSATVTTYVIDGKTR